MQSLRLIRYYVLVMCLLDIVQLCNVNNFDKKNCALNITHIFIINKQVLQLNKKYVGGMDISEKGSLIVRGVSRTEVPGENPHVQTGYHHTLSHTTTLNRGV